jgi:hypothetical protein
MNKKHSYMLPKDTQKDLAGYKTFTKLAGNKALVGKRTPGEVLLQHLFPDDPSFLYLIFEELNGTTAELGLSQESEKCALHHERCMHMKAFHIFTIHPEGNQYLVQDAHRHIHYGVWRTQMVIIMELLDLLGKITLVVPYQSTTSHRTTFAIVRNGLKDTANDPGFKAFDFAYVLSETMNKSKGSRANVAESYGYSTQSFEATPDNESGHYRPSLKKNTAGNHNVASAFLSMSDSVLFMDKEGLFYDPSHTDVVDRQKKFSWRIGMDAGFDHVSSQRIIGEGLTLFLNPIPNEEVMEWSEQSSTSEWQPKTLRHLELELEAFLSTMPIKPHTDRKNCRHENFNILACTSKCLRLHDGSYARMGGLLYFRDACSYFVSHEQIGDVMYHLIESKINELPIELREVTPHVPRLL